ncbi:hypothetical protein BX600DRAFT_467688 [Xylariales sp. PMI_506]|nr:hypothetical protein BX600DRAFT_467688 [Xylariales sp. PMI_506]
MTWPLSPADRRCFKVGAGSWELGSPLSPSRQPLQASPMQRPLQHTAAKNQQRQAQTQLSREMMPIPSRLSTTRQSQTVFIMYVRTGGAAPMPPIIRHRVCRDPLSNKFFFLLSLSARLV